MLQTFLSKTAGGRTRARVTFFGENERNNAASPTASAAKPIKTASQAAESPWGFAATCCDVSVKFQLFGSNNAFLAFYDIRDKRQTILPQGQGLSGFRKTTGPVHLIPAVEKTYVLMRYIFHGQLQNKDCFDSE